MAKNGGDPQHRFVAALAQALHQAHGFELEGPILTPVLDPVSRALKEAAGGLDGLRLELSERGIQCGKRLVPASAPGATGLSNHLLARGVRSVYFPKLAGTRDLWRFLSTMGKPAREIDDGGGALQALHTAGVMVIQVEEQPPMVLGDSNVAAPPDDPQTADSFVRITREIVQSFQIDGPDAVAMGLLMVWRQLAATHGNESLPSEAVSRILPQLDPVVSFMVLSRLAGTDDGRRVASALGDASVAAAVSAAIVARVAGVENSAVAVVATARSSPETRHTVLREVQRRLDVAQRSDDPAWQQICKRTGAAPTAAGEESNVRSLLTRLRDSEDRGERRKLCLQLVEAGAAAVGPVVTAAREGPWYFLRNLLKILGDIGDESGVATAMRLLRHPHQKVRLEAIRTLGKVGSSACIKALAKIAGAHGEKRQRDAFGPQGSHLESDVLEGFRTEAIALLGLSGNPHAVPVLQQLLLEPPVSRRSADAVRKQAAQALSSHGSDAAGRVLMDAVRDTNRAVRDATREALQSRR